MNVSSVSTANMEPSEVVVCPCCHESGASYWAEERGLKVVRCHGCRCLYVNPRPTAMQIDTGVRLGQQAVDGKIINVRSRRVPKKIPLYKRDLGLLFADVWRAGAPVRWLDVGSGYGETLEAVQQLAPQGSELIGIEPMEHKAIVARERGLKIFNAYLLPGQFQVDIISAIDIFSHIANFHEFLAIARSNLAPGGSFLMETGNLADLDNRREFFGELGLPDHLVFAGESSLEHYLKSSGFKIVKIQRKRVDGVTDFAKSVVKKILKQPVHLGVPYTSRFRQLVIRAEVI